jgi:26S proteasome regulatory subunit N3
MLRGLVKSRVDCLQDVASKLGLASVRDTESVVAKTIRDGSIAAVLDHEKQVLRSCANSDVYVTKEPQDAFHARTAFCMDIHNEAVKAMRYDTPEEDKPKAKAETTAGLTEAIAAALAEDGDEL